MISRRRNNRIPNLIINIQRLEFFVFKFVNQVVSNLACHRYPILKSFVPKLDRGKLASNQFKPPQTSLSIPLSSPNSFKQEILSKISFKPSQTTSNHLKPRQTTSNPLVYPRNQTKKGRNYRYCFTFIASTSCPRTPTSNSSKLEAERARYICMEIGYKIGRRKE